MAKLKYYQVVYVRHDFDRSRQEKPALYFNAILKKEHPLAFIAKCNRLSGNQRYAIVSYDLMIDAMGRKYYDSQSDRMKRFIEG